MDKSKIAINIFNKHANAYQEKFMDVSLYSDALDFFCRRIIKQNAEILDMACGPGNITRYLLNKRADFKIIGIDLAPNMIELAKINNPDADFQLMDCRNIGKLDKKFDAIICSFCMPYLSKEDSMKLINDASRLIKSKGIFYLSTMEDDYLNSGFKRGSTGDEIFMYYHEAEYLQAALIENHFRILHEDRKEYFLEDGTKTTDLILIAGK